VDSRQAKEILLLYREGIDRPDDSEFAEALALANRDPVLATWLEQQRAVRAALRASFKQIAVPEGLKEQIVSERRARMTLGFKRKALLASAAAAVLVIATAVVTLNRPPGEDKHFSGFQSRMASIVLRSYPQQMDLVTNDLGQIHEYLVKQGRRDYVLPAPLDKTAGTGCKLLTWQGKPVSMVCLNSGKNGNPKRPDLFLFVINQNAVPDPSSATPRDVVQVSKLSLLSWAQNGNLYLLGALGPQAKLLQDSVAADVRRL
jgi:hypothetical protein